ncbi:MAG: preprotein translocase subunit YajC [Bacteroidota bacterium]|jgi:preprotein translocase subunit YajC|nr:preprotein translocase subunit YajC [Bacteroidota bacterium]
MLDFIILQTTASPQNGWMGQVLLFGGIAIVFYFFMIRPQQKKAKDQKSFLESIKKGDQVVTIGGLHGRVFSIEDDTLILEIDRGTKIKFEKTAISQEASKKYTSKTENK